MESLIVAFTTGGLALIGTIITVRANASRNREAQKEDMATQQADLKSALEKHEAVTDTKIDALKNSVERHNTVIERTYRLEADVDNLFHRYEEHETQLLEAKKMATHASEQASEANRRLDRAGIDRAKHE